MLSDRPLIIVLFLYLVIPYSYNPTIHFRLDDTRVFIYFNCNIASLYVLQPYSYINLSESGRSSKVPQSNNTEVYLLVPSTQFTLL